MKKLFLILFLFIISCSTVQKNSSFNESKKELKKISQDENLTKEQKIIIKHAINDLKIASDQNKEVKKLTSELINKSENAGAGKIMKYLLFVAALGISGFIILKLKSIFL